MSDRERWIVYPLLFFAWIMGFRATYMTSERLQSSTIECNNLVVSDNLIAKRINGQAPSNLGWEAQLEALRPLLEKAVSRNGQVDNTQTPGPVESQDKTPRQDVSQNGIPTEESPTKALPANGGATTDAITPTTTPSTDEPAASPDASP